MSLCPGASINWYTLAQEWRANISKALKEFYRNHDVWNRGKSIHSEEARKRISESCRRSRVGKFNKKGNKEGGDDIE
jgi:hypothetical protein